MYDKPNSTDRFSNCQASKVDSVYVLHCFQNGFIVKLHSTVPSIYELSSNYELLLRYKHAACAALSVVDYHCCLFEKLNVLKSFQKNVAYNICKTRIFLPFSLFWRSRLPVWGCLSHDCPGIGNCAELVSRVLRNCQTTYRIKRTVHSRDGSFNTVSSPLCVPFPSAKEQTVPRKQ